MSLPRRLADALEDLRSEPARLSPSASLGEIMRRRSIPGVGLAVVADGELEWAGGFGVRHADDGGAVDASTLFQAGSISKPVAALCALRLVADGELDLDEDIDERLTSWRVPETAGWRPRLTVRQLLSHTAGLTVHGFPGYRRGDQVPTLVDVLDGRGNTEPIRVRTLPGVQFSYSGGGYCVLQQLLVDVTGEPFPSLAQRVLFDPLAMRDSTYEQPLPEHLHGQAAAGHRTAGRPVDGDWHVYPEMAAAGLWTTPRDLAHVVMAIQRARSGIDDAVLPRALVEELLTPHATNLQYGLGVTVAAEDGDIRFHHGGDDQGFVAWLTGHADGGVGAVVMTNSDAGFWVIEPLLDAIARAYGWPGSGDEPVLRTASAEEADACVGLYESSDGYRFTVQRAGEGLVLALGGQAPIELAPATATEWHALPLAVSLEFELGDYGRAESVTLRQRAAYVHDVVAGRAD